MESDGPWVIPVIEETVVVGRQTNETGRVRIVKSIEESSQSVPLTTKATVANITRVPVNRLVEGSAPTIERRGEILVVPVVEEVLVTEKRLYVREEIHIDLQSQEETRTEEVTLRREIVTVYREPSDTDVPREGEQT